jgi:hypothetical protein
VERRVVGQVGERRVKRSAGRILQTPDFLIKVMCYVIGLLFCMLKIPENFCL